MNILITGANGFVGKHLISLLSADSNSDIVGLDIGFGRDFPEASAGKEIIDLTDSDRVMKVLEKYRPDRIYHLAGQSSVKHSWENPTDTFKINVFGGINLLEGVKEKCPDCRTLVVCTAEEYDSTGSGRPLKESNNILPENPYAISKTALDFFAHTYSRAYNMPVYITRSFNHTGPGQSERFVCSDFAKQVAEIESGLRDPLIKVGNLEVYRDFLDVRDVVRAYYNILAYGRAGQVYNVCSGKKFRISWILNVLISMSTRDDIKVEIDRQKFRPSDYRVFYGSNRKLRKHTGWKPEYGIDDTLKDTLDYWRKKLKK